MNKEGGQDVRVVPGSCGLHLGKMHGIPENFQLDPQIYLQKLGYLSGDF